ncbi:MAG: hypothetical protein IJE49_07255 [Agathobacter sp.]|nr:hypothetical protein [Agathobacter sp.]
MYIFFREKFLRIDRKCLGLIVMLVALLISGCGTSDGTDVVERNKLLSVEQIQNDEKVISYFSELNMEITSVELEKRKTEEETGYDYAYLNIVAENDDAIIEGEYEIVSCYYDVGGWLIESIQEYGEKIYLPQEDYDYSWLVNNTYMEEYSDRADEMKILSAEKVCSGEYNVNAAIYEYGKVSDYIWEVNFDVVFDTNTGEWKCDIVVESQGDFLKDVDNLEFSKQRGENLYTLYISVKDGELSVDKFYIGQEEIEIKEVKYKRNNFSGVYGWRVDYYEDGYYGKKQECLWIYVERDELRFHF